jgi:tellurite methyltransferase
MRRTGGRPKRRGRRADRTQLERSLVRGIHAVQASSLDACDIGAGWGHRAIALAVFGFRVLAIDRSPARCETLARIAETRKLSIRVRRADATRSAFRGPLAFVCTTNLLHLLEPASARRLVAKLKRATAPGGVHLVSAFMTFGPRARRVRRFATGELLSFYSDWEVIEYREVLEQAQAYRDRLPYAIILARRSSAAPRRRNGATRRGKSTGRRRRSKNRQS